MLRCLMVGAVLGLALAPVVSADTIVLKNGDTVHGKIGEVSEKQIKFHADAFGDVTIDQGQVKSYKIDEPVVVQRKDQPPITASVQGEDQQLKVNDQPFTFKQIKSVNAPPEKWTGSAIANFALARGNTNKFTVGSEINAGLRRDNYLNNDRFTLGGAYNYGESGGGPGGEPKVTDTDNWNAFGKYDRFWTDQLYGYVGVKVEHDRIANLDYRLSPNMGLGYQWIESPATNFSTEAGVGFIREQYSTDGATEYGSLRFAYHLDHAFSDTVTGFHNLEYLPSFTNPADYNLNADAGLKVKIIDNFIAQLKLEYHRDSTPAPGALKNDLLWLIGLGWQF